MGLLALALQASPYLARYDPADWSRLSNPGTLPAGVGTAVAFSPDGALCAIAYTLSSPYIGVYRTSDWSLIALSSALDATYAVAFSPDGSLLAVGREGGAGNKLILYNTSDWSHFSPASQPPSRVTGIAWSPDGATLAVSHWSSPGVTRYRTSDWAKLSDPASLPVGDGYCVAWSPNGAMLAVGSYGYPSIAVYNTGDWSKRSAPTGPGNYIYGLAFSPDSALLAAAWGQSTYLAIYQTSDGSAITGPASPPAGIAKSIAFSADGTLLAVGHGTSPYLSTYHTSDWSKLANPGTLPNGQVNGLAFTPLPHAALAGDALVEATADGVVGSSAGDLGSGHAAAVAAATGALHGGALPSGGGWLWRPRVTVGGADVSAALTGTVDVEAVEGEARIADVTLLPAAGSIEPATWVGMAVAIDYGRWTGSAWAYARLFTGLVDVPEYDAVTGLLRLRCTDDLQGRMLALSRAQIDALTPGTRWSAAVFDAAADNWRYAQDRMATLPAALDIDPAGTIRLTPWTPTPAPALAYDEGGILDGSLALRLASRSEVKNRITVSFAYRYLRYKRRVVMAGFNGISDLFTYLAEGIPVPTRAMCLQALQGTGWEIVGDAPTWTTVPAGPIDMGDVGGGRHAFWIVTDQNLAALVKTTDGSNKVLPAIPIAQASQAAAIQLTFGFTAALEKRYTQQIEEQYALTVEAALSIAQLGVLPGSDQASLAVDRADASAWESWRAPQSLGQGTETPAQQAQEPLPIVPLPNTETGGENYVDYTPDAATDRNACAGGIEALIAKAQVAIWASHRLHRVALSVPLEPAADLSATVRVDTARITAQGKLARVRHVMDMAAGKATTDLEIALCAVAGTGIVHPADAPAAPDPPAPDSGTPVLSASAYEWVGSKASSAAWNPDEMIGFSCNVASTCTDYDAGAPVYPEQFTFQTPEIEAASRDNQVLPVAQSYAAALVEDQLVIVSE